MYIGLGCDIQISINGGGSYTSMGFCTDFDIPGPMGNDIEKSYSQQSGIETFFRPGMVDPGEFQETIIFNEATLINLLTTWYMIEDSEFLFIFPNKISSRGTELNFLGYVKKPMGNKIQIKEGILLPVTIKVSGPISIVPAA